MENSADAESGAGRMGRKQDRADSGLGHSDCQNSFDGTGRSSGTVSRRVFRTSSQRPSCDRASQQAKATPGGMVAQLIESLSNQRALFEAQIQLIDEQIQAIEALRDELIRQIDENEE